MKFSVPLVPKTINHVPGHWSWKKREMEKWMEYFQEPKAKAVNFAFYAKEKRQVTVQVFWAKPGVLPDPDNVWAGSKPIIDALVRMGFVFDDSQKWLNLAFLPIKRSKKSFTIFEIV